MAFTREELLAFRDAEVPDLIGSEVRLLFVGINPSLWAAATQAHFARPGNRFYPALSAAGILHRVIDAGRGMSAADRKHITGRGMGITNVVERATIRADELSREELREGAARLAERVERWSPRVVAVAGITAYRLGFNRPKAAAGRQPETLAGARLWVVPNPSGLNAHHTVASLAAAYAEPAQDAGILE